MEIMYLPTFALGGSLAKIKSILIFLSINSSGHSPSPLMLLLLLHSFIAKDH